MHRSSVERRRRRGPEAAAAADAREGERRCRRNSGLKPPAMFAAPELPDGVLARSKTQRRPNSGVNETVCNFEGRPLTAREDKHRRIMAMYMSPSADVPLRVNFWRRCHLFARAATQRIKLQAGCCRQEQAEVAEMTLEQKLVGALRRATLTVPRHSASASCIRRSRGQA